MDFAFKPSVIATADAAMQFFKNEKLCEFVLISLASSISVNVPSFS